MRRWFAIGTCVAVLVNGARLRVRLNGLVRAGESDVPVADSHVFLVAGGVGLTDGARRAASAHAAREGLDVLDLVPADLASERVLDLARTVDTGRYRKDRFASGQGAAQALLVDREVLARAGLKEAEDCSSVELMKITKRLKQHAPTTTDLAVVAGLTASRHGGVAERVRLRAAVYRFPYRPVVVLPVVRTAAVAAACVANPWWGLGALALCAVQPAAVSAGRVALDPRDLLAAPLRRLAAWPASVVDQVWAGQVWAGRVRAGEVRAGEVGAGRVGAPVDLEARRRRARYQAEISAGVERLLEARRDTCPWCGSEALKPRVETADLVLRKPGRFRYEQCRDCGHVFQNPRLTPAGLDFYYRDFYDGLNAEAAEGMFAASDAGYRSRATVLPPSAKPTSWLDVGAGHGHFCLVAGGLLPDVTFDAVDMGDGVAEAERRGWVRRGYRKMFPDMVDEIAGRYDVISMFHYLEHTPDPMRELDAAAEALPVGGHLVIEVPNPQGPSFSVFGGLWVGLYPPQHLHLVPPDNLVEALAERGLRAVRVQFGAVHLPGETVAAVYFLTQRLQPDPTWPWLPYEPTPWRRARRLAALAAAVPLYPLAFAVDAVTLPFLLTGRRSNAYRVVARKDGLVPDEPGTRGGEADKDASPARRAGRK